MLQNENLIITRQLFFMVPKMIYRAGHIICFFKKNQLTSDISGKVDCKKMNRYMFLKLKHTPDLLSEFFSRKVDYKK